MSRFLKELKAFLDAQLKPNPVIRISEMNSDGKIETLTCTEANPCQNVYSVAKTFTMTAVGLLYDRHMLQLDEKICDILADMLPPSGMDDRFSSATVEMALTHRLGLPEGYLDIDAVHASVFGFDYLSTVFTCPLLDAPGTTARYSDAAYYLLSRIVTQKAGIPMENLLWRELFYPLGFREMAWSRCPMGYAMGATGLYITSEDMVKLGWLYLSGGVYLGKRILSEEWVHLAVENGYSLHWDNTHTVFAKGGMCGQILAAAPEQKRAIAMQSYGGDVDSVVNFLKQYREE